MAADRTGLAPGLDLYAALKLAGYVATRPNRFAVAVRRGAQLRLPRHPGAPDPADLRSVRAWIRARPGPTAIDLFCGAGGLGLGLHNAGLSVLVGADSDPWAVETYGANMPCLTYRGDLSDPAELLSHLKGWGIFRVDVIAGGVPCQPFSRAGRSKIRSLVAARIRHEEDARADLWQSFIRVVGELKPKAVVLENVPDLAEWDGGAVLIGFCDALRTLGYDTDARILNAYEHGVPQYRTRLFIIGVRPGIRFQWPAIDSVRPTLWDAISDLPEIAGGNRVERLPYGGPLNAFQRRMRHGLDPSDEGWIDDHIVREVRADDLEAFRLLPEGGKYRDLPQHLRRYRSDIFKDKYNRLVRSGLSRTITAHIARDGYWYIHPVQHRTLSVREAARIQTFPDSFRFAGEPSHRLRQIGNAVPVLVGEAIGEAVVESFSRSGPAHGRALHTSPADLTDWHAANSRRYEWRQGADPWLVLLAELYLSRASEEQAASVYRKLVELAATPRDLLRHEVEIRPALDSLGLMRVDDIFEIAQMLVQRFDGTVPASRDDLLTLPGVGDYIASAVICFGFGRSSVLIDAVTERIVSRVLGRKARGRWQLRLDLYRLAGSNGAHTRFNAALLDLGATVCRTRSPFCLACPVARHCQTFKELDV